MTAHPLISGGRYLEPKRRTTKSRGKRFTVATIDAKRGETSSRVQLHCRLAVLTILAETQNQFGQAFQARVDRFLRSLPEAWHASFKQAMGAGYATIALTPILFAAEVSLRLTGSLRHKVENSPTQKEHAMTALKNIRQEAFCQFIAAGKSATAAYAGAYGRARDATSRVNGRRLLTNANIRERVVEIRCEEAKTSLPMLRQIIEEAGQAAVHQIRTGSFRRACQAAERFADMIIKLSA